MRTAACAECGNTFETNRASKKYCSDTCRKRAAKHRKTGQIVSFPANSAEDAEESAHSLASATEAYLIKSGRVGTVLGQQALKLARRMESSSNDTGSSVASLSREFRAVMDAITATVHDQADPVDELRRRREAKLNAG